MDLIEFWFSPENSKKWFTQNKIFDKTIYDMFNKELEEKRTIPLDELKTNNKMKLITNIILFDQISRNVERLNGHTFRKQDDYIAIKLAYHFISIFKIDVEQEYLYFIVLPLRHSKRDYNCQAAIIITNNYEKSTNYVNNSTWLNFKCATYRSLYNSSSMNIISKYSQCFNTIHDFRNSIDYFKDIIDESIIDINTFETIYDNNSLYDEVLKSIKKYSPDFKKAYCISLSGGVDSMCIAHILSKMGQIYNFDVHAVHIKHSNRNEAKKEAEMIKEFCFQLRIKFHKIDIDHIQRHSINREYYESETRRIRFDFYNNIKTFYGIELFSLGHHKGDIAENVLTNLLKGRTILDLPVMNEFDEQEGVTLWRPLLNLPKSNILEYAKKYGIMYTKNSTPEWSVRGKLRNIVLPQLNTMFNSVEQNLYNAGEESRDLYDYINKTVVNDIFGKTVYGKLGFYFPIEKLKDANFTIWKLSLQKIFHNIGLSMLKDHVVRDIMKLDKKINNPCKDYISYYDDINLIFFNVKYFNLFDNEKGYTIKTKEYSSSNEIDFTIKDLINGIVKYTIDYDDVENIYIGNVMEKHMKQRFNKILPGEILNKYIWMFNEFKAGNKKMLVEIEYLA
jgi:tRNA(Ile)-lysidine synthetase-like protein